MESLFDRVYENTQPLRKYEPLIRFDQDGKPQPRRPLDKTVRTPPEKPIKSPEQEKQIEPSVKPAEQTNDRKRPPPTSGPTEPVKKKQQVPGKQQKLTQFFMKK